MREHRPGSAFVHARQRKQQQKRQQQQQHSPLTWSSNSSSALRLCPVWRFTVLLPPPPPGLLCERGLVRGHSPPSTPTLRRQDPRARGLRTRHT